MSLENVTFSLWSRRYFRAIKNTREDGFACYNYFFNFFFAVFAAAIKNWINSHTRARAETKIIIRTNVRAYKPCFRYENTIIINLCLHSTIVECSFIGEWIFCAFKTHNVVRTLSAGRVSLVDTRISQTFDWTNIVQYDLVVTCNVYARQMVSRSN